MRSGWSGSRARKLCGSNGDVKLESRRDARTPGNLAAVLYVNVGKRNNGRSTSGDCKWIHVALLHLLRCQNAMLQREEREGYMMKINGEKGKDSERKGE